MVERHVGVLGLAELRDDVAPEARRVHDVDLVDRGQTAAPQARELEPAPRDALHLGARVLARVEPRAVVARALRAEVEPADELADDEQVDPGRRLRGAEVRVDAELLPEPEEALLGADGLALELGQADGAEQDGVGRTARRERLVGERRPLVEDRVAAERVLGVLDPERVEHADRLVRDLGADPVARQDRDVRHAMPWAVS